MKNYVLKTYAGDRFADVVKKAKKTAQEKQVVVEFEFNEITCYVNDKTVIEWLDRDYRNAHIMEWKTVGPNCSMEYDADTEIELYTLKLQQAKSRKQQEAELEIKDRRQKEALASAIKGVNLEFKDEEAWKKSREANSDGYGAAALDFAEAWAKKMQIQIAAGETVEECADYCQNGLEFLGITGFQYGCAVSVLSQAWKYGENLKKWHNKKYGRDDLESGVVNPAVITIN